MTATAGTRPEPDLQALHGPTRYADLILAALRGRPDRTAFHWHEHGRRHASSYQDTADHILRLSRALTGLGLDPSGGVALLSGPRPKAFTTMAAACHAGIRYSALHPMAAAHDDIRVLRDSGTVLLIVDEERFPERARAAAASTRVMSLTELNAIVAGTPPSTDTAGEATYLFYTGGTTGEPKGVILTDRSLTANAWASATWPWPADTQFLLATPMSHAAGLLVAPGLLKGATFHLHAAFDPARLIDAVERDGITATFLVPTMLYSLLDHPRLADADLRRLRWLLYGAAPTSPERIIEARERFGSILTQHYGQAEAPNALTMLDQAEHCTDEHTVLRSCGRALPGIRLALLDRDGAEVPDGSAGELCVRGPIVMDGYWNKPEQTAAALADGWLHTGDVATRDASGRITLIDRLKDIVITGGFNVYPREVELVLEAHPAVAACAVFGEPDDRWGESVVAAVTLHDGLHADEQELIAHVRTVKGAVWAPKRIEICDSLPLTAVGKIDKKALRGRSG